SSSDSSVSDVTDTEPDSDDLAKELSDHVKRAAIFFQGLAAPSNLHPSRYVRQTPKLRVQLRNSGLPSDIKTYRRLFRVLPEAFDRLVEVLSPYQVFARRDPRRAQATVTEQLAVTLYWLGRSGNGGGTEDVALACGCAEGSVHLYILRVVEALYDARSAVLCWASEEEKADARAWVAEH
ncbi:hypothetical protein V8E36_006750, partial [Tilletia maclaganii]